MSSVTITDFLLARIAEDEKLLSVPMARRMIGRRMVQVPLDRLPSYVERDRTRWAAECEAKRAIVGRCQMLLHSWEMKHSGRVELAEYPDVNRRERTFARSHLEELAAVYADHPDYQEEWRV